MADTTFSIQLEGLDELLDQFEGIGDRVQDLRPVGLNTALAVQADVDERFETAPPTTKGGKVLGGVTWEPLTEKYLKARDGRGKKSRRGGIILSDTGQLKQSFVPGSNSHIGEYKKDSITVGTNLVKARGLQNKRPFLFVYPGLTKEIVRIWRLFVVENKK